MMPAMSDATLLLRLARVRSLAVVSLLSLVGIGLAWELWLAPTGRGTWAFKVLPLTLGLTGVLKLRLHTYRWLSLLVWAYVAESLVRAVAEGGTVRALALLQLCFALLLFTACVLHVRGRVGGKGAAA